jgi:hypothetical protein
LMLIDIMKRVLLHSNYVASTIWTHIETGFHLFLG